MFFIENKVLLKHEEKYKEVLNIGNMQINCFIKNIAEMQNCKIMKQKNGYLTALEVL